MLRCNCEAIASKHSKEICNVEFSVKDQLRAAATVWGYQAAQLLGVSMSGKLNGVPDREWFAERFTFAQSELLDYLRDSPGVVDAAIESSLNTRGSPSAYIVPNDEDFEVGWFDGARKDVVRYALDKKVEAVTDYVLAFWGLQRLA